MTEEEKKAIEDLKSMREYFEYQPEGCNWRLSFDEEEVHTIIDVIINLLEKQQKEIEASELINNNYEVIAREQQKEIEELKKITNAYDSFYANTGNRIVLADKEYFDSGIFIKKYISKDKIRNLLKQVNASLYHFKDSEKNNIIQRIKDRLEQLLDDKN